MNKPKKILNNPKDAVREVLDGLVFAYGGQVMRLENLTALVKTKLPEGKVGLLVGGGSGHEPLFPGFIGTNMADGAACGNVFAAPTPDVILAATKALDRGNGVLYVYGNYAGDNLNFDMAVEMADEVGVTTRTVRIWDDVAAAPKDRMQDRRGIAGDLFVIKIAGGVSSRVKDLDEVFRIDPDHPDAHYNLALVKLRAHQPLESMGQLELELAVNPRHQRARRLLAEIRNAHT